MESLQKKMEKADFSMESGVYGVGMLGGRGWIEQLPGNEEDKRKV